MNLLNLFLAYVQIGALSFGGGYAAMPLIQAQVIDKYGWMTIADFTDLVTIAEMTPGPIAVNSATFVGNQVAGIPGALVATFGCILPSCIFVTFLAWLYTRYHNFCILQGILMSLRPAVVSMILTAGITILTSAFFYSGQTDIAFSNLNLRAIFFFLLALYLLRKKHLDPIKAMVLCGIGELASRLVLAAF